MVARVKVPPAMPRPAPATPQVSRRTFLRTTWLAALGAALAGFAAGTGFFLWPNLAPGGFGTRIRAGTKASLDAEIKANDGYAYVPAGRFYIVPYDAKDAGTIYKDVATGGYMALYQRCPHLGCRVPWCATARWWECPCHGSKYNHAGEYKEGPAPRGLDRFPLAIQGDQLVADTSRVVLGPPRGTNTTGQELEGPHCVGGASAD